MMRTSPVMGFTGTPIYNFYLRLMGAKIGRNVVISSRHGPVCADLLSIGDNTILRKDSILIGYRAQSNFIHTGPRRHRRERFRRRSERPRYRHRDGRQHAAWPCLVAAERPARAGRQALSRLARGRDDLGLLPDPERRRAAGFRTAFYLGHSSLPRSLPVAIPVPIIAYRFWEQYSADVSSDLGVSVLSLLGMSAAGFFGALVLGLASVYVIPRLCMMFLKPGVTYPTFGFHYLMQSIILRASNSHFFCVLFGDSSFITTWMSKVGWNLNKVEQTGSNMGTNQRHDNPFLCNIGSGTMVSDGLSMINTHMSATSFQLAEVEDRREQLPRQRHLLSAERQDRRERAARHQDA